MSKNKMKKVAKIFGVKIGEEFDVVDREGPKLNYNPHKLTKEGLVNRNGIISVFNFLKLMRGDYTVQKIPWVPKSEEGYYYVCTDGSIGYYSFDGNNFSLSCLLIGNCFPTSESAEANKEGILAKFEEIKKMVGVKNERSRILK